MGIDKHCPVLRPLVDGVAGAGGVVEIHVLPVSVLKEVRSASQGDGSTSDHMLIPFGLKMPEIERIAYEKTLNHLGGDKLRAARSLGVSERTLHRKLAREDSEA